MPPVNSLILILDHSEEAKAFKDVGSSYLSFRSPKSRKLLVEIPGFAECCCMMFSLSKTSFPRSFAICLLGF